MLPFAVLFDGGDWPPASFALRVVPFALAALLLRRDAVVIRPTVPDLLLLGLWALEAAALAGSDYRWVSYQWFLHHTAALLFYALVRSLPGEAGDRFARAAGVSILAVAAAELPFALWQGLFRGSGRPDGTFANPNDLAEYLVYAGVIAWAWREGSAPAAPLRKWYPAAAAVLLAGVVMTKSRGGIVIAAAAGGWIAARAFGWKRVFAAAAGAVVLLAVIPNPLRERFLATGDPLAYERLAMWKAAFRVFLDHPLGVGVGHFKYYWHAARDPVAGSLVRYAKTALTPHSEFFSILSELGLPGAVAFAGLGAVGAASLRAAARSGDVLACGAGLLLFVSYLNSFLQTNYHVLGLLFVNAAALATVSGRGWPCLFERELRVKGAVRWAALVLLLAMAAYSGMTLAATFLGKRGHDALAGNRFSEAVRGFSGAAAADPLRSTYPDQASAAAYRLYESRRNAPDLGLAIEWEIEAAGRNPVDYLYPARLGFLYLRAADLFAGGRKDAIISSALRSYDRALSLSPHDATLRYGKALALREAGRFKESRGEIEAGLRDEPSYAKGWLLLGQLLEREDASGALRAYRTALSLHETWRGAAREIRERDFVDVDAVALGKRIRELEGLTPR